MTSDCLSRLENHEQTGFDEQIVRDVAGLMFSGKFVPKFLRQCPGFSLSAAAAADTVCSEMGYRDSPPS